MDYRVFDTHTHKLYGMAHECFYLIFRVVKYWIKLEDYTSSWGGTEDC